MKASTVIPTMHFPPFPKMKWDGYEWKFALKIDQLRGYPVSHYGKKQKTKGTVDVVVEIEGGIPTDEQVNAYRHFCEHLDKVIVSVLRAGLKAYKAHRKFMEDEGFVDELPLVRSVEEFMECGFLETIRIHTQSKSKHSYLGFYFHSDYEMDHGYGVCVHRSTVKRFGIGQYGDAPVE